MISVQSIGESDELRKYIWVDDKVPKQRRNRLKDTAYQEIGAVALDWLLRYLPNPVGVLAV